MAGFESHKAELEAVGASVYAASADDQEGAAEVAGELSFAVGHGLTKAEAAWLGAWWDGRRGIIQPAEFVIGPEGRIVTSTYSSGPIGRIDPEDVVRLITFYESES